MSNLDGSADAHSASGPQGRVAASSDESDLDPAAFLKSVRELSEKREREDLERFRKLEEEVQKGREERAARRAERARSISPEKLSVVSSSADPTSSRTPTNVNLLNSPAVSMTPPSSATRSADTPDRSSLATDEKNMDPKEAEIPEFKGFGSVKRSNTVSSRASQRSVPSQDFTTTPIPSASNLARSGTLSWQQRPGPKQSATRPQSMAAVDTSATNTARTLADGAEPSRDQIAASLAARDPTWFKQTADRGMGSAAYRKSREEFAQDENIATAKRSLPGMAQESPLNLERHASPPISESLKSDVISRTGSMRESTFSNRSSYSATSNSSNRPDLKSLIAADEEQQRASPSFEGGSVASTDSSGISRNLAMSNSQARLAIGTERSTSPTKGMGGFVQSAMMKRNDSQTKRWSAQPGAGLSRNNSVTSNRSGLNGLQGSHSMPRLEPTAGSNETTTESPNMSGDLKALSTDSGQDKDGFVKPALPQHNRTKSVASSHSLNEDGGVLQSPGSPSKRWNPNKSSWIESSLTRPESPKPTPSRNSQPTWMADLAKAKAKRSTTDLTGATTLTSGEESSPRLPSRSGSPTKSSAPFGKSTLTQLELKDTSDTSNSSTLTNKLRPTNKAAVLSESPGKSPPIPSHNTIQPQVRALDAPIDLERSQEQAEPAAPMKPDALSTANSASPQPEILPVIQSAAEKSPSLTGMEAPSIAGASAARSERSGTLTSSVSSPQSKPEAPPKPATDFRSVLKSRPAAVAKPKEEPEFLSKFGNLRKAQQERYIAPDVLKDNIVRGKSSLSVTSGPVKTPRKDEFRESLLAKKDDIKKAKEEGRELPGQAHERKASAEVPQLPTKPEGLTRRELLGRSDSARSAQSTAPVGQSIPEALQRHKSLRQKSISEGSPKKSLTSPAAVPPLAMSEKTVSATTSTGLGPDLNPLSKQTSEPSITQSKKEFETSKLAARFNPSLANLLARGPPSNTPSRPENTISVHRASTPQDSASESRSAGEPLQDMRKDRAKGPKRRKGAKTAGGISNASTSTLPNVASASNNSPPSNTLKPMVRPKPVTQMLQGENSDSSTPFGEVSIHERRIPLATAKPKPSAPSESAATSLATSQGRSPGPVSEAPDSEEQEQKAVPHAEDNSISSKPKPQALPGSAAAIMMASLSRSPKPHRGFEEGKPSTPTKIAVTSSKIREFQKSTGPEQETGRLNPEERPEESTTQSASVPEFKGFGSARAPKPAQAFDEGKDGLAGGLPSVRAAASIWQRQPSPSRNEQPSQIQLPTKKDEDAAMRSAGLLGSNSLGTLGDDLGVLDGPTKDNPLVPTPVSANLPPKPTKSSRAVSGQLAAASPSRGSIDPFRSSQPSTEVGRLLMNTFEAIPKYREPLTIDTSAVITSTVHDAEIQNSRKVRTTVQIVSSAGAVTALPLQEEYTLYSESTYVCSHVYITAKGAKASQVFVWSGESALESSVEAANVSARKLVKDIGSAPIQNLRQGQESAEFLKALGGIVITRRGSRQCAAKQYMLCGRKHLGHIVFDEVDFSMDWMCSGFVYLVSHPITLQETKLYLWKGQDCSPEESSAARLAAMYLSENGEVIEVDGGAEFPSFLKVFGSGTTKSSVPKSTVTWRQKATSPLKFKPRLFRVQQAEAKTGFFTSLWNRRPSWNSNSPARSPMSDAEEIRVEVREQVSIIQSQLDVDGIYLFDTFAELYIFMGPLLSSYPERVWSKLLGQTLLFASDYAIMSASIEDRPIVPKCQVLFSGTPRDVKLLFRHWDDARGLWGTAGLMAGSSLASSREVTTVPLDDMLTEVCRD